ncbi:NAD(P)H-dependent oxidoreductase [Marinivivus vitaminiproducens]|uniref:NAD(P)H-dependent oxidoreductase n=1 Tax=Marinivivus vitaminiproducens TaxID=3035935 RepID=UPI00279DD6B9|nr:NAD(P)H-dependent oxidoreductase [Geminicoccaceae bacterium SCSIO 64248]
MHVLIVHCHPEPRSFNAGLTETAALALRGEGHSVEIADLYAEGFDPVEGPAHYRDRLDPDTFSIQGEQRHASEAGSLPDDVRREIERLDRADLLIVQFPIWWHNQPAMLKGWFDRVLVYGGMYTGSRRYDRGRYRGRRAICAVTAGAPEATFSRHGRSGPLDLVLWPIHYSLHYMGYGVLAPFTAYGIQSGGGIAYEDDGPFRGRLERIKADWAERLKRLDDEETLPFAGWADMDERGVVRPGSARSIVPGW